VTAQENPDSKFFDGLGLGGGDVFSTLTVRSTNNTLGVGKICNLPVG
jgi:hypothetical protein